MEATTTKTGAKAKPAKAKGKKPASKPATATREQFREQFRAECAAHVEALAILSEAEDAVLALVPVDEKKEAFSTFDVLRSYVFSVFPA